MTCETSSMRATRALTVGPFHVARAGRRAAGSRLPLARRRRGGNRTRALEARVVGRPGSWCPALRSPPRAPVEPERIGIGKVLSEPSPNAVGLLLRGALARHQGRGL